MLSAIGRAAVRRVASSTRSTVATSCRRVTVATAARDFTGYPSQRMSIVAFTRSYASAAASKTTGSKTTKAVKKPAAKKTAKKPAKKVTKAKKKPTAKPKPKPRARKVLTPEEKDKLQIRELKKISLYSEEPKLKATNAWTLYVSEKLKGHGPAAGISSALSQEFAGISHSEKERLQRACEENKLSNAATRKAWIESHTVQAIAQAKNARQRLKRKFNYPKGQVKSIIDDRQPKRPAGAYAMFCKARLVAGNYENPQKGITMISKEWNALSESDRQPYVDLAEADKVRYSKEAEQVFGKQ